jgi:3'-phosphoadenosine 5'-phosphosulfate sulfotransferase (PAPS reductase)/FAD synthetase
MQKKQVKTSPHGGKHFKKPAEKSKTYIYADLKRLHALSLSEKIAWSNAVIDRALAVSRRPSVAFSAGKDSTVLLALLRKKRPEIDVIWGNTTQEFPECIKFAKFLRQEWALNFHEARPDVSFWWVVEEYGWPLLGKTFGVGGVAHKSSREKFFDELAASGELTGQYAIQAEVPISSACCSFLKERPSTKIQKELGVDCVFLGILAGESRQRMFNFLEYGEYYKPKTKNQPQKCHPLAIWTDDDIWAYIRQEGLPYASLYDMGYYDDFGEKICHKRNGCMFCGMDIRFPDNHLAIMRRTHPQIWKFLMIQKGLGKVLLSLRFAIEHHQYDLFASSVNLDAYLERHPCFFDRI